MNAVDISPLGLAATLAFVLLGGISSLALRLDLQRDLLWGTARTVAQLFLMGYVLRHVFRLSSPWPVLALYATMVAFAARIVAGRVRRRDVPFLGSAALAMLVGDLAVTLTVTAAVVQVNPWWEPRYFIPLGGMVAGNTMNAVAVALDRLLGDLRQRRDLVEMYLSLGASAAEASAGMVRDAVRAGMIPSISSMMGVGIVFLPGMMTGQIVAGADPLVAVKYQIVVMLMLVAAAALSSILAVLLVRRRCFSPDHRLLAG